MEINAVIGLCIVMFLIGRAVQKWSDGTILLMQQFGISRDRARNAAARGIRRERALQRDKRGASW